MRWCKLKWIKVRNSLLYEYSLGILKVLRVINFFKGLEMDLKMNGKKLTELTKEEIFSAVDSYLRRVSEMESNKEVCQVIQDESGRFFYTTKEVD